MSPYFGKNFFEFFPLFFTRMGQFLFGSLTMGDLASDEIQIFVLCFISIASTLVGVLLVLKKMTMLANALSHTILLGIVIAYLLFFSIGGGLEIDFKILLIAALITGLLTTVLTEILTERLKLQKDASIGLVFTTLFALGIVLVTIYTRNAHIGLEVVMGNADALHSNDVKIALAVTVINALILIFLFKEWELICFDSGLAASLGFRPTLYSYLLMFLASTTAIAAFRAVGVLLFLAFLVGLPVTARFLTHNLKKLFWIGSIVGVLSSLLAVSCARHLLSVYQMPLSTAGLTVAWIGCFFFCALGYKFASQCFLLKKFSG